MRKILLKLECRRAAGGCCGGNRKKPSVKYAILDIEEEEMQVSIKTLPSTIMGVGLANMETMKRWNLIEASPLMGNIMTLAKKYGTEKPEWAGTVLTMGLDKDPDFMAQLNARALIKKGCVIAE